MKLDGSPFLAIESQDVTHRDCYELFMRRAYLAAAFILLVFAEATSAAPRASSFPSPFSAYQTLRDSDAKVKKPANWEKVRKQLEQFVAKNPRSKETPQALFFLGELNESLYTMRKDRQALGRAAQSYERIARKFEGDELADNALLALGDLRRESLRDDVAARAAYYEIVDRYPESNLAKVARLRLNPPQRAAKEKSPAPAATAQPVAAAATPAPKTEAPKAEAKLEPTPAPTPAALLVEVEAPAIAAGTGKDLVKEPEPFHRPLIVIDPGHGGEDLGAKGVNDVLEKDVVLLIAKDFDRLLQERLRARTFLTRSTDVFIPLAERTRLANEKNADLFISIHANASEYKTGQGIETYYLDNTKEKSSLKLAERENASLSFGPKAGASAEVSFILSDLIQNVKLDDSISLAHVLEDNLVGTLSRYYQGVTKLGVKKAPFYVLVGAHMPCVLVEVSFIDHPLEGKRLGERRYQHLIAQSLYEGVQAYFAHREKNAR